MKQIITAGATSQRMVVFVQSGTSTVGAGLTAMTYASAGLSWYWYSPNSGTSSAVTLATGTVGTWASGGFKEIDATNMPGFYEIGVPNVCLASSPWTVMSIQGFAGMVPVNIEVDLTAFDLTTATQKTNVVQWLGTAVTSAAGVPSINVAQWLGTAVTAATGGIQIRRA